MQKHSRITVNHTKHNIIVLSHACVYIHTRMRNVHAHTLARHTHTHTHTQHGMTLRIQTMIVLELLSRGDLRTFLKQQQPE